MAARPDTNTLAERFLLPRPYRKWFDEEDGEALARGYLALLADHKRLRADEKFASEQVGILATAVGIARIQLPAHPEDAKATLDEAADQTRRLLLAYVPAAAALGVSGEENP